jgi:hypothetical protein
MAGHIVCPLGKQKRPASRTTDDGSEDGRRLEVGLFFSGRPRAEVKIASRDGLRERVERVEAPGQARSQIVSLRLHHSA